MENLTSISYRRVTSVLVVPAFLLCVLASSCASRAGHVRCDGRLEPINAPVPNATIPGARAGVTAEAPASRANAHEESER